MTFVRATEPLVATNGDVAAGCRALSIVMSDDEEITLRSKEEVVAAPLPFTLVFSRKLMKERIQGIIEFQNVQFHYPLDLRKKVLDGFCEG